MQPFLADLHIHSRHSRATSKGLTPRHLAAWGEIKGISVVATGDFTHPGWLAELKEALVPDDAGLLQLADPAGLATEIPWLPEARPTGRVRFMLSAEISSIYKRGGKVRKVHNLLYAPSFEAAERVNAKLAKIGNLTADGRPILGLDSRHLLELTLETDPLCFLVPAHIWTPWFSLFGSKSGFDSVEECFGSLSREIFALETGLSSDPEMNWTLSALDRFRLLSNSDAHSGEKLGRECNLFTGPASYTGILNALRGRPGETQFGGTVEFFPEEGKYHLDGHRDCGVVLEPAAAKALGGLCPKCGKPLTLGVLHRVLDLADRDTPLRPDGAPGFTSLVPLDELAGEVCGVGPKTGKVRTLLAVLLARFGSELAILRDVPAEELRRVSPGLAEAVTRMRQGKVARQAGFDGQFGRITVFSDEERRDLKAGRFLAAAPMARTAPREPKADDDTPAEPPPAATGRPLRAKRKGKDRGGQLLPIPDAPAKRRIMPATPTPAPPAGLTADQAQAAHTGARHVLVLAGPGTGKTHTLLARIRSLLDLGVAADKILAVTFTRRAAAQLRERLAREDGGSDIPRADTLHALALAALTEAGLPEPVLLAEKACERLFALANPELSGARRRTAWKELCLSRERLTPPEIRPEGLPGPQQYADRYAEGKREWNLMDFTDLLETWLDALRAGRCRPPWTHVLVDEVQDLTPLQLAVIAALAAREGTTLFAIGDPDQSIYGFRGASGRVAEALRGFWPDLATITLTENFRSAAPLLEFSAGVFPGRAALSSRAGTEIQAACEIQLYEAPTAAGEAAWVAERVAALLGGSSLTLTRDFSVNTLAPGDIAVLVRFSGLIPGLRAALDRAGLPVAVPEAEAFWNELRVRLLLGAAAVSLGIPTPDGQEIPPDIPERILAKGPLGLAAFLADIPPFDRLFWQGTAFRELVRAYDAHGGWAGLLGFVAGQNELEMAGARSEKVRIMSVHAAKGLEFAAVFLPALEDGLLPFAGSDFLSGKPGHLAGQMDEAEERRLFYVGLTRAKSRLYLSHAVRRELYGRKLMLKRSRFLDTLPLGGVRRLALTARTVTQAKQLGFFGEN
ncbi:UvrD-helicase domain-containing protein [Desulfovibrio aerotolerans]|uniref:UvrD-helicase domain-containing protein n=1 Tax=Solidesulfovibrio aerotolerans TaxID=295255 RepID=A0A7C9NJW4_9BACT|nr:UvrD-helicase domain-containing protein [Solidesulfovibrio aerotolerans]MYL83596.1 UvrD-helicase domain-containing protein [Solidesulfovibrio aerotolerans]